MRRLLALTSVLIILFALLCTGVYSAARARRVPLLLFSAHREGGDGYGGDLYLYDLHDHLTFRLTRADEANTEYNAVMSPDLQHVVFSGGNGTVHFRQLVQLDEMWKPRDAFMPLMWYDGIVYWNSADWSPNIDRDVMHLAYSTNHDPEVKSQWYDFDIWVVDVPMRRWTPDDLVVSSRGGAIPVLAESIMNTRRRLTRDDFNEYDLAWSPDGSQMAYASDREGNLDIYVLDTDGINQNIRPITDHLAVDAHPTWSPDGEWLAFMTDRDSNWEIYVVSLTDGELRRLTFSPAQDVEPAWSPDGAYIAYNSGGTIMLMRSDGSESRPLFDGAYPSWIP